MNIDQLYLSAIDEKAPLLAGTYGLGLEITEFSTAWNLDDDFPEADRRVRKQMEGLRRFTLHGPFSELYPCAVDRKARKLCRERFLQTISIAERYGIPKVVFHAGFDRHLYFPQWFRQESIAFFEDFVPMIPPHMTVCLENVLEESPDFLTDILSRTEDPRLRMCLDVGHAAAYSSYDPIFWIRESFPYIDHFHIHNNDGRQDLHAPLPEGVIPMEALFAAIEEFCPQATAALELSQGESSLQWLLNHNILK